MYGRRPVEVGNSRLFQPPEASEQPVEVKAFARGVAYPDHDRSVLGHKTKAQFRFPQLLFRHYPIERQAQLACNGAGQAGLALAELMRVPIVGHELADDPPVADKRDKRKTPNPFAFDHRFQGTGFVSFPNIGNEDRGRVERLGCPRRVTVHRFAVLLADALPRDEAHDGRAIEQKNRCAVALERFRDCLEGRLMDLLRGPSSLKPFGQVKKRPEFADCPRQ